jgi:uncharacterized membrane protein
MNKEKTIKKITSIVIAILILATLKFALDFMKDKKAEPKTFSGSGFTINLTNEFTEKSYFSQTAAYSSPDCAITILKEPFSNFQNTGYDNMPLHEYANWVIASNKLNCDITFKSGFTCFVNNSTTDKDYTTLCICLKGNNNYWMLQFIGKADDYEKLEPVFLKYANSFTYD